MASSKFLEMLEKACKEFQQLDFLANDRDRSLAAFESFRRAVVCLRRSEVERERCAWESVEPKSRILEFFLDFSGRYIPYRSRMAELLRLLQASKPWITAMEADLEAHAAIQGIIHEAKAACSGRAVTNPVCTDLEKAAAVARGRGDLGVLSVRIIAAHDLNVECDSASKMGVSMILGNHTSSSLHVQSSPEPRWNSQEFVFDVGVRDWLVAFKVCNKIGEDVHHIGMLSVALADIISHQGRLAMRRSFDDVSCGELELVLQYVTGSTPQPDMHTAMHQKASASAPALAAPPQAASTLKEQQMTHLWASHIDAVPTPQKKTTPTLPVASKTGGGAAAKDNCEGIRDGFTTKRAADPWAPRVSSKAPKTPKTASGATPSKRGGGISPALRAANTSSNPFKSWVSPRFQQSKSSNPFKGERTPSGVGKKMQKAFDNLWA